ncbi:MAG TPA: tetratricopeptide repeat protein, partial [Thermoanaerobaculia bacterium]|nr:tetratricopeptide repeat protein [Thermoanaerobaculia bacterium]
MSSRRPALALAALVLLGGCTSTGFGRTGASERSSAESQELKARVLELQRRAAVTEVELERLRARVAELEARAGIQPPPPPPAPRVAPPPAPSRSRAEAPDRARRPEPVVEIEDITVEEVPRGRPAPPSAPPPAVEEPSARPAPSTPAAPSAEGEAVSAAAQALYDRGYTLYHQGRFVDAESSFQRFIQAYPDTELTDNAQYWIGESRLSRGDVRGALAAFRETVERHPRGN